MDIQYGPISRYNRPLLFSFRHSMLLLKDCVVFISLSLYLQLLYRNEIDFILLLMFCAALKKTLSKGREEGSKLNVLSKVYSTQCGKMKKLLVPKKIFSQFNYLVIFFSMDVDFTKLLPNRYERKFL